MFNVPRKIRLSFNIVHVAQVNLLQILHQKGFFFLKEQAA